MNIKDFDGDTIAIDMVPKDLSDVCSKIGSPRNLLYWRKNGALLFTPNHECMMGHTILSAPNTEEDPEVHVVDDLGEAIRLLKSDFKKKPRDRKIFWNTVIRFSEDTKKTTIGRAILSAIYCDDIFRLENMLKERGNDPLKGAMTAKDVAKLLIEAADLEALEDEDPEMKQRGEEYFKFISSNYEGGDVTRELRIQTSQYWTLLASTKSGATAPKLSRLFLDPNDPEMVKMFNEIKAIEDDPSIDEISRSVKLKEIYSTYINVDRMKAEFRELGRGEIIDNVEKSARAKPGQLLEMTKPGCVITTDHAIHITKSTFIQGKDIDDLYTESESGRGVQDIKTRYATPTAGYGTRQLETACNNWNLVEGEDPRNPGIYLFDNKAWVGRTQIEDKPRGFVRSLITSQRPRFEVTTDVIDRKTEVYRDPSDKKFKPIMEFKKADPSKKHAAMWDIAGSAIGTGIATSLMEGVTQASLGLKHGGFLLDYNSMTMLYAGCIGKDSKGNLIPIPGCEDVKEWEVEISADQMIILRSKNRQLKYPLPENFAICSYGRCKQGDLVGASTILVTPGMKCDGFLAFIQERLGMVDKKYLRNTIILADCYCVKTGKIHYEPDQIIRKDGSMQHQLKVFIGGIEYETDLRCKYFYPEGTEIKAGERFCSGIQNMKPLIDKYNTGKVQSITQEEYPGISYTYDIFRQQCNEQISGLNNFVLEFLFSVIFTDKYTKDNHKLVWRSVLEVMETDSSTFAKMARQSAKPLITRGTDTSFGDKNEKGKRVNKEKLSEGMRFTQDQLTDRFMGGMFATILQK